MAIFDEYEFDDPRSLEFGLDAMPPHKEGTQMVPIPPKARPAWAERLYELGYRHHRDLMTKFPVPGDQPGMGWMNPNKLVSKEEFEKASVPAEPVSSMEQAMVLLESINPALAQHVASMPDEARKSAVAEQEAQIPELLSKLAKARELMETDVNDSQE